MPLRERAKALFRSKSSKTDGGDALSKTSTKNSSLERWPSNVYRPGEPMPRPKYRAVPKKEHTEKLQAFSFPDAWRKRSFQSTHSPMGTRLSSRRNSSCRPPSRGNSFFSTEDVAGSSSDAGRSNSLTSLDMELVGSQQQVQATEAKRPREGAHAVRSTARRTGNEEEEGDSDVGNGSASSSSPALSFRP